MIKMSKMSETSKTCDSDKSCRTRRKVRRKSYCKTLKNTSFFNKIQREWKKKTKNGSIKMDLGKNYTCDYYFGKKMEDGWNHVHLMRIVKFPKKIAILRSPGYCFKKLENDRAIHSKIYLIDLKDEPCSVVDEMLTRYNDFINK